MPTKLGIALLGTTVGGVTFLFAGLLLFLMISQQQDRIVARGPVPSAIALSYAQLDLPR